MRPTSSRLCREQAGPCDVACAFPRFVQKERIVVENDSRKFHQMAQQAISEVGSVLAKCNSPRWT